MKQYDSVLAEKLIYDSEGNFEKAKEEKLKNIICMSIEEAKELWHMGYNNGYTTCQLQMEPDLDAFKRFMASKGINI